MRALCVVTGCERDQVYRTLGYCPRHYHRHRRGLPVEDPRQCATCGAALTPTNQGRRRRYCGPACYPARRPDYRRRYYERNRELEKRRAVANRYGLTPEEYDAYIARGCALCGATERVVLDHDHETGLVRDALCQRCNVGLGNFDDDPERLRAAAGYIDDHRNKAPLEGG